MRQMILGAVTMLCVCVSVSKSSWAQDKGISLGGAEAEALARLQAIRSAYKEGRDTDVLLAADRALLETARVGGSGVRVGEIHFWRGAALRRMGRTEEALVAFDQAKALGFQEPELYLERSLTQRSLGQVEEAEKEWQEGERFMPEDLERWERLSLRRQKEERERSRLQLLGGAPAGVRQQRSWSRGRHASSAGRCGLCEFVPRGLRGRAVFSGPKREPGSLAELSGDGAGISRRTRRFVHG